MMCVPRLLAVTLALAATFSLPAREWGDQGDGTYRNPILKADYSDPDVIRVGEDFYLVASEFHFMGIQVLHSRDLVNWRIIGQVFSRLPLGEKYDTLSAYGQGTWAPSLRFHEGKFYLYVCTPQDGLLLYRSTDPAGPWELTVVKTVAGWEDPCPFWDDDGAAYLVRGQVGAGPIFLHRMSIDGTQLLDDGVEIYHGPVAEGPKVYKRNGWYYIALPEGGVAEGGQTMLRSRNLAGPYERREVLPNGSPHQGGIVELDGGESWFIGFKSTGHLGRLPHLVPVTWGADDWPAFGDEGKSVMQWKKPTLPQSAPFVPLTSDEFEGQQLGVQWQWNHNPVDADWSLTERPGWLRLRARPAAEIRVARNTLTQKLWDEAGVIDVKLSVAGLTDGQRAGLAFQSGNTLVWAGVSRKDGAVSVAWDWGGGPRVTGDTVWLHATYSGDRGRLFYSVDGERYFDTGLVPQLRFAQWKGARVALFGFGAGGGHVDFDFVRYRHAASLAELTEKTTVALAPGKTADWYAPVGAGDQSMVLVSSAAEPDSTLTNLARELAARNIGSLVVAADDVALAKGFLARIQSPEALAHAGAFFDDAQLASAAGDALTEYRGGISARVTPENIGNAAASLPASVELWLQRDSAESDEVLAGRLADWLQGRRLVRE